ncbi:hypothetical protein ACU4GR_15830 [Methylobacterium oryzae CBMB20]
MTEVPWDSTTTVPRHNPLEKLPVLLLPDGGSVHEVELHPAMAGAEASRAAAAAARSRRDPDRAPVRGAV